MKKFLLLLMFVPFIFNSCTDESTYYNEELYFLNEPDIKANQMQQVGNLFENIARQPEMADELINATEAVLYSNITDILPISDTLVKQRGEARGIAFSALFQAIARQPEARYILDDAAAQFLGEYDSSIISNEMNEFQKTFASTGLIEGIARQPEMYSYMDTICGKYFNCDFEDLVK